MQPVVSVLMSVYNSELYVKHAIESIINQTYSNFEFIIINDGSTDKSLEIIESYKKIDNRIVLISRENKGLIYSLNEGISLSKGEYIVRMDSDDISLPERIQEQVSFMDMNPQVGVCGTGIESFGEGIKNRISIYPSSDTQLKANLLFSPPFAHPSVIIRKSILEENNILYNHNYLHAEDYGMWVEVSDETCFSNLKKVLLKYRVGHESITAIANKDLKQRFAVAKLIQRKYLNKLKIESEEDIEMHYNLSVNTRIRDSNLCFYEIERYFDKIINANNKYNVFDVSSLKKLLGKKWLWNIYYRRSIGFVFSKYFFYGVWGEIIKN